MFFFFNDTATTEIYTLSLHDALPICPVGRRARRIAWPLGAHADPLPPGPVAGVPHRRPAELRAHPARRDRKSTRLNSSHANISYAVFCLKKKIRIIAQHRSMYIQLPL